MAEKKFIKGLFKDTSHIDQPEGSWRYALNAFLSDKDGSVSNEGGTFPDGKLPKVPTTGVSGGVEQYLVIGTIRVDDNRVVLFLRDQRSDTSSNIYRSAIAIWEGSNPKNTGYVDGVKILYDDFELRDSGKPGLNFNKDNLIEGTFKIDSRQNLIIYFTDDLNPPRAFNITRQEESYRSGALGDERAILEDRTPKEYLQALRTILGRLTHRKWLNDVFCEYAYDIIDQYEWLDHVDELRDSQVKESRQYIESITTMF